MANNLDLYRLPLGLSNGVEIALPKTDVKFLIDLPANANEKFMNLMLSQIDVVSDREEVSTAEFMSRRRDTFFKHCVREATGLPDGMTKEQFFKEFPLAERYLFDKATTLAGEADEQVELAMGNLESTPNGKTSGQDGKSSTSSSKTKASQSKLGAPN